MSHAGYSPYSVANYTVMLMLMCIRKAVYIMVPLAHGGQLARRGRLGARNGDAEPHRRRHRHRQASARPSIQNLSGFGCHIVAHDPYPSEEMKKMGVEYVSLDSLYAQSDIVTLHTFLNDETFHMINAESIRKMKPGVVIIQLRARRTH